MKSKSDYRIPRVIAFLNQCMSFSDDKVYPLNNRKRRNNIREAKRQYRLSKPNKTRHELTEEEKFEKAMSDFVERSNKRREEIRNETKSIDNSEK